MLGELFNEFDLTDGSLGEFNRLFPFATLEEGTTIVIGEPIREELIRIIEVDGVEKEHNFDYRIQREEIKAENWIEGHKNRKKRTVKPKYTYFAVKNDERVEFNRMVDLAEFLGRTKGYLSQSLSNGWSMTINGYKWNRIKKLD